MCFTVADSCSVVSNEQAKQSSLNKDGESAECRSGWADIKTAGRKMKGPPSNQRAPRVGMMQAWCPPRAETQLNEVVCDETLQRFSSDQVSSPTTPSHSKWKQFSHGSPEKNKMSYCLDQQILCVVMLSARRELLSHFVQLFPLQVHASSLIAQ